MHSNPLAPFVYAFPYTTNRFCLLPPLQEQMEFIVDDLLSVKESEEFRCIDPSKYPHYYELIESPMDLTVLSGLSLPTCSMITMAFASPFFLSLPMGKNTILVTQPVLCVGKPCIVSPKISSRSIFVNGLPYTV